jgi:hypothetical protein
MKSGKWLSLFEPRGCKMKYWIIAIIAVVAMLPDSVGAFEPASFAALPPSASVCAQPPGQIVLQGTYAVVGERLCVWTPWGGQGEPAPTGFDNDFTLLLPATMKAAHFKGTYQFNKDGTGKSETTFTQLYHQNLSVGQKAVYGTWAGGCELEYYPASNGSYEIKIKNCEGLTGAQYSGSDQRTMSLEISSSREVLLLADTVPHIETVWLLNPDMDFPIKSERLCTRTATAVRIR